jgi:hypothetical protein
MAVMLPLVVLFVPETAYKREQKFDIDTMGNLITTEPLKEEQHHVRTKDGSSTKESPHGPNGTNNNSISIADQSVASPHSDVPKQTHCKTPSTWTSSLRLFSSRLTPTPYLSLLLRPFPLFLHPTILWACLVQGVIIGWTVLIGIVLASIMLGPPLWFGEVETGYMYTGAFIGALVGFGIAGLGSDWSARVLTRWNGGVYEPEMRLVMVVPQIVLGAGGLYGFGVSAAEVERFGWVWPDFFFGMVVAGLVCGAVASSTYVVDAHRECSFSALFLNHSLLRT